MNKTVTASIGVIILLLVVGGAAVVFGMSKQATQKTNTVNQVSDKNPALMPASTADQNKTPAATITYTDDGLSPAKTTVKSGEVVKVVNNSSQSLEFSSDPHPVHTKDTDLNQQVLAPGQSQVFTVTKKGTFGYHDHLNATKTGTITIE